MTKKNCNEEYLDEEYVKRQLKEFEEEREIIDAQSRVKNNPHNLYMKSYKFSNIPDMIREARLVNGYTQQRLSSTIGINRSTYSRYENGKIQIPYEVIDEIFDLLNIEMIIATSAKDVIMEKRLKEWE